MPIVWVVGVFPDRGRRFFPSAKHLYWLLDQLSHQFTGYEELSTWVRWQVWGWLLTFTEWQGEEWVEIYLYSACIVFRACTGTNLLLLVEDLTWDVFTVLLQQEPAWLVTWDFLSSSVTLKRLRSWKHINNNSTTNMYRRCLRAQLHLNSSHPSGIRTTSVKVDLHTLKPDWNLLVTQHSRWSGSKMAVRLKQVCTNFLISWVYLCAMLCGMFVHAKNYSSYNLHSLTTFTWK